MKKNLRLQTIFICSIMLVAAFLPIKAAEQTSRELNVVYASTASCSTNDFVVMVKDGNELIADANVILIKDGLTIDSKRTSCEAADQGVARFSFNLSPGLLYIIVTKSECETYCGTCRLDCSRFTREFQRSLWLGLDMGATFKPFVFWQNFEDYFLNRMAFNAGIKLEYRWRPWISLVLDAGYNEFKLPPTPRNQNRETRYHWWNIVPSIRYYFPFNNFKPYLAGGPALFMPREGHNRLGFKVGLGFDYSISERFTFEVGTEYFYLFAREGDPHFNGDRFAYQHAHAGISYRLN